jgi:hypothetical protein
MPLPFAFPPPSSFEMRSAVGRRTFGLIGMSLLRKENRRLQKF